MKAFWIDQHDCSSMSYPAEAFVARSLSAAEAGDVGAYFDLGIAFATGSQNSPCDFVEAHKWFDIAASEGHEESAMCRDDLAREMAPADIVEAKDRARRWLAGGLRQAA